MPSVNVRALSGRAIVDVTFYCEGMRIAGALYMPDQVGQGTSGFTNKLVRFVYTKEAAT
jgi:hypothetical protein